MRKTLMQVKMEELGYERVSTRQEETNNQSLAFGKIIDFTDDGKLKCKILVEIKEEKECENDLIYDKQIASPTRGITSIWINIIREKSAYNPLTIYIMKECIRKIELQLLYAGIPFSCKYWGTTQDENNHTDVFVDDKNFDNSCVWALYYQGLKAARKYRQWKKGKSHRITK